MWEEDEEEDILVVCREEDFLKSHHCSIVRAVEAAELYRGVDGCYVGEACLSNSSQLYAKYQRLKKFLKDHEICLVVSP